VPREYDYTETDRVLFDQMILAAKRAAQESDDPHRQVGAAIFNKTNKKISAGANSLPDELIGKRVQLLEKIHETPESKYFLLEHAERTAIVRAVKLKEDMSEGTIACTLFPCADCARALVSHRIKRLVVPKSESNNPRDIKWNDHYVYSRQILVSANVEIIEN
jgi:deoxycytidylate deaminase